MSYELPCEPVNDPSFSRKEEFKSRMIFVERLSLKNSVKPDEFGLGAIPYGGGMEQPAKVLERQGSTAFFFQTRQPNALAVAQITISQERNEQPFFRTEMVQQARVAESAPLAELSKSEAIVATFADKPGGLLQYLLPPVSGAASLFQFAHGSTATLSHRPTDRY